MTNHTSVLGNSQPERIMLYGARCAMAPQDGVRASLMVEGGRIVRIEMGVARQANASSESAIDLSGFLVMPGLVNAHDHLEFALFPRLANPPYLNYVEWGQDIHERFPDVIAKHRAVPKDVRLWWGGIRNLLCGVTTLSHHNPMFAEIEREDFPVKVIRDYGWCHSVALGGDVHAARAATPPGCSFIVHACEGIDELARQELWQLDALGVLDESAVLVHGLAMDPAGIARMNERNASLVVCPSSNRFLFGVLPNLQMLCDIRKVALGSDSPLTAEGDLLDEARYAIRFCKISPEAAYRMVTDIPAAILRRNNSEGCIEESGIADLIAVKDNGDCPAERLRTMSMHDVELVIVGGRVQLASPNILDRLLSFAKSGLEPLSIDGTTRWLRAPIKELLATAEAVLGKDMVRLGSRRVVTSDSRREQHAT